jgi:hypothetical protein
MPAATAPPPAWPSCQWVSAGGKTCRIPASTGEKRLLCSWHSAIQNTPRLATDLDEFERWIDRLLHVPLCCLWTHYRTGELWSLVQGTAISVAGPFPCQLPSCSVALERDREPPAWRPTQPVEPSWVTG